MKFFSPNFEDMGIMPVRFTADGENVCPEFEIYDVPDGTASLAIVCHDPDATSGVPWIHWLVWGLPPETTRIQENNIPNEATSGVTSFGAAGYGGPSPSPGTGPHRYVFTLYALSGLPNLTDKITLDQILEALSGSVIASSNWTGIYQRA